VAGASHNGGEHSARRIVSGKAGLHHSGSVVNNQGSNFFVTHLFLSEDFFQKKKRNRKKKKGKLPSDFSKLRENVFRIAQTEQRAQKQTILWTHCRAQKKKKKKKKKNPLSSTKVLQQRVDGFARASRTTSAHSPHKPMEQQCRKKKKKKKKKTFLSKEENLSLFFSFERLEKAPLSPSE
jgi:hypothetical protein